MDSEKHAKQLPKPQLVKLDRSFKLAEQWVNNMSKCPGNEESLTVVDMEGRPSRLGIGAIIPRESKFAHSNDPVERKLFAKLNADKRKMAERTKDLDPCAEETSDEDESESKTKAFSKKRPQSLTSLLPKKKHR